MPKSERSGTSGPKGHPERTTQRNGYRERWWDTRLGTVELQIPKLRTGTYFPSWLEPRKRSEQALVAVVAEAYVQGVSTRKVEALGIASLSKSEVSRLCGSLDEQVQSFRDRRLAAAYPYLWLDARYEKVWEDHRVVSMAAVVAYGVREDGVREVLGIDIGLSEDVEAGRAFAQNLVARGEAGDQRCPPRPQTGDSGGVRGCDLATLSGSSDAQSPGPRPQGRASDGRGDGADDFRADRHGIGEAVLRLFGALLIERNDEWLVGRRYFGELSMRQLLGLTRSDPTTQLAEVAA